jgi:hypothetical protein
MPDFILDALEKPEAKWILRIIWSLVLAFGAPYIYRCCTRKKYREKFKKAIAGYTGDLGRRLKEAVDTGEDDVETQARSVVSMANDLRAFLAAPSRVINDEIDRLKQEYEDIERNRGNKVLREQAYRTICALNNEWASKEKLLREELRNLIGKLGLDWL